MYRKARLRKNRSVAAMGAFLGWITALVVILAGVVAFQHLGLDLSSAVASWMHSLEHTLARPL
jgi:hypothetical protein